MEKEKLTLPDEISKVTTSAPRDLAIIGIPKSGKGTILGNFTLSHNALILDLEKDGYEYIPTRKMASKSIDYV
jgi:hypothetical protein